jgi:hypothetical protein
MVRKHSDAVSEAALRSSLRRRIRTFYQWFNLGEWKHCYAFLDPRLRENSKIALASYADSLRAFRQHYGQVNIWHVRINLYTEDRNHKHDNRPFAYVYVFWQDHQKAFHVFREHWVRDGGRWYTRVVGLVVHEGGDGKPG